MVKQQLNDLVIVDLYDGLKSFHSFNSFNFITGLKYDFIIFPDVLIAFTSFVVRIEAVKNEITKSMAID